MTAQPTDDARALVKEYDRESRYWEGLANWADRARAALSRTEPVGEPATGDLLDVSREFRKMQEAGNDGWSHEDGWTLMATESFERLKAAALAQKSTEAFAQQLLRAALHPSPEGERDAVRYRWLRDNHVGQVRGEVVWLDVTLEGDTLDDAIDRAMKRATPPEGR
jgi:hypothetical protein